jgi:hypothetical protein
VSPAPQHGAPAGDAFVAIRRLARSTGGDVQELLTLYALEGLLARVAASSWVSSSDLAPVFGANVGPTG